MNRRKFLSGLLVSAAMPVLKLNTVDWVGLRKITEYVPELPLAQLDILYGTKIFKVKWDEILDRIEYDTTRIS